MNKAAVPKPSKNDIIRIEGVPMSMTSSTMTVNGININTGTVDTSGVNPGTGMVRVTGSVGSDGTVTMNQMQMM